MTRRDVLKSAAAAACQSARVGAAEPGLTKFQLGCMTITYSEFSFERALKGIAAAGYRYVGWGTTHKDAAGNTAPVIACRCARRHGPLPGATLPRPWSRTGDDVFPGLRRGAGLRKGTYAADRTSRRCGNSVSASPSARSRKAATAVSMRGYGTSSSLDRWRATPT